MEKKTQKIINLTQTGDANNTTTEPVMTEEQTHIVEEMRANNMTSAYTDIFTGMSDAAKCVATVNSYKKMYKSDVDLIAKSIISGGSITDEMIDKLCERFKAMNKPEESLTSDEIDELLSLLPPLKSKCLSNDSLDKYKRSLLTLLISFNSVNEISDNAQKELDKISVDFNNEMNEIISCIDLTEKLSNLRERIATCENPEDKKKLEEVYNGMYASVHLTTFVDKINNKGIKIIRKEIKKKYDSVKAKAIRRLKNDNKKWYMNPSYIDETLFTILPEYDHESIKLLTYMIYRELEKRNTLDITTSTFINYFILGINKLTVDGFKKEESDIYQSLIKCMNILKDL